MTNVSESLTALSDPTRRTVFERLIDGPLSVAEIARDMPVSRPAVSQHLRVLKDAGLVVDERNGTRRIYRVDPAGVDLVRRYFDQFWSRSLAAFKDAVERGDDEPTR
jgi:DNA-binding transcriptional ArsR family regulator